MDRWQKSGAKTEKKDGSDEGWWMMNGADVWTANTDNVMETGWSKKIERQTLRSIENNLLKSSYKQNQITCGFTARQPNSLLVTGRAMSYDGDWVWCKSDERRDTRSCREEKGLKSNTYANMMSRHWTAQQTWQRRATAALFRLLPPSILRHKCTLHKYHGVVETWRGWYTKSHNAEAICGIRGGFHFAI